MLVIACNTSGVPCNLPHELAGDSHFADERMERVKRPRPKTMEEPGQGSLQTKSFHVTRTYISLHCLMLQCASPKA